MQNENSHLMDIHLLAYNAEDYISQCIESFKSELNEDIRLVVLNDNSTDSTLYLIKKNLKSINKDFYKIINLKENIGRGAGRNLLASKSRAKYIATIDSDDICYPNRFKKQLDFMSNNDEIDISGGYADLFEKENFFQCEDLSTSYSNIKVVKRIRKPISHNNIVKNLWLNPLINPTICIKRSALLKANNYDPNLRTGQDYDLWFRLYINNSKFANLPIPLIYYRKSSPKKYNSKVYMLTYKIAKSYRFQIPCLNIFTLLIIYLRCLYKIISMHLKKLK